MKLSEYAKKKGVCYRTAYNWFKLGIIPNAIQLPNNTILIEENNKIQQVNNVVIYCRVSNHNRKEELEYQVKRCEAYCIGKGYQVTKIYKEVASGMNDNRKELWKMIDNMPTIIIVENKDRLTRFGFNYLDKLLNKLNCQIEVINMENIDEKDLIKDMISIITSFCCRLYGLRRGYKKATKIKEDLLNDNL